MKLSKWLFWNVDTQIDFVYPRGKLYVEGAENLRANWKRLTELAKKKSIRVVNTADYHFKNSAEIDDTPDYIRTFPEHCMVNTRGADFIKETDPEDSLVFEWNKQYLITSELFENTQHRNFTIHKDAFNVFAGSPHTDTILNYLHPEMVVVYGLTTNYCVDGAVMELTKKVKNVLVVEDAIKELPGLPLPFRKWKRASVKLITLDELEGKMT